MPDTNRLQEQYAKVLAHVNTIFNTNEVSLAGEARRAVPALPMACFSAMGARDHRRRGGEDHDATSPSPPPSGAARPLLPRTPGSPSA